MAEDPFCCLLNELVLDDKLQQSPFPPSQGVTAATWLPCHRASERRQTCDPLPLTALEPAALILWSRCSQTLPTRATAESRERPAALTLPSVTVMALRSFDTPHSNAWTGCTCCGSNHHVGDSATMASFVLLVNTTQHRGGHKHFFCCIFCVSGLF